MALCKFCNNEFIKDYTFNSLSQAASVILGTLDDRKKEWKEINSKKNPVKKISEDLIDRIIVHLEKENQLKIDILKDKISEIIINTLNLENAFSEIEILKEEIKTLKEKQITLEDILEYIKLLYLKRAEGPVPPEGSGQDWIYIYIKDNQKYGFQKVAKAKYDLIKKTVIVFEGSDIIHFPTQSFKNSKAFTKYRTLLEDGSIIDYKFTRDVIFNSLSGPASIILGRSANGKITWTLDNGEIIDSILEN
jgi:hypothetical protein